VNREHQYWFPAKEYGWGWGVPKTWQGWVVLIAYIAALLFGGLLLDGGNNRLQYLGFAAIATVILVAICWLKGEPPRWRWGRKS